MKEMKETIIVTGGAGYIGSHTVVELINSGYNVLIMDDLSNSDKSVLDGLKQITGLTVPFYKVDICDKKALFKIIKSNGTVSGIIHFAAFKAFGESVQNPLKYNHNNLVSLINVLDAMKTFQIEKLVFSSSCTVYGQPDLLPVTEETPIQKAESPYGNTKQICEEIILDFLKVNFLHKAILLRYFNPIGAHPSAKIGELPIGVPNNLIPFVTQTAAGIRKSLQIFGSDYNTPDGTAIRDYINVLDLANAHVKALEYMNQMKTASDVFNIGTGNGNSVLEIVKTFVETTGISFPYQMVDRRPGDIEKIWADTSKAENKLGWKAFVSLADSLQSAWQWQKRTTKI